MVKGPKFLNPADKARKEARKKELKKNKKQRLQVRSAAIESKDPEQVIADLEKLDRFEFDVATNPTSSDTIYKDKRKRLKETWSKILAYYLKEDPERHSRLKSLESEYEIKHKKLEREFEGIKAAIDLKIEDVFLPPEPTSALEEISDDDPLLSESAYITPLTEGIKPPGCPPGLPPDFKQLADCLASSLTAPIPLDLQTLLPDLINLGSPQNAAFDLAKIPYKQTRNNRSRIAPNHQMRAGQQFNMKNSRVPDGKNCNPEHDPRTASLSKSAVIESKPVLFKPKATKFVPTSVRSKLTKSTE